jgi:hypothetical protein
MSPLAPDAPATSSPTVREGFTPITQGSFQACSTFNAYLARAKTRAIECLLNICENADNAATPADIRRAATAILRCTPLHDDDQHHTSRPRPRLHIPDKPPIIQPTPVPPPVVCGTGLPTGAEEITDNPPCPNSTPCSNDETTPSAHTPPPPAPAIAHLLGEPSPQSRTPRADEIFRALAALEALRKSDPQRHQSLDPGNTLQPLIDFIRSVYPVDGLPPDHPLSIAICEIESAHRAAKRQTAALDSALADLHAAAPSNISHHHYGPAHADNTAHAARPAVGAPSPNQPTSPAHTLHHSDAANNTHTSTTDPRGPPTALAA